MSYHQKYLKYKQKYLDLKKSLNMAQSGGAKKVKKSLDIDDIVALTESPEDFSAYGYELEGGGQFHDSDNVRTTTTIEDIVGGGDAVHSEVNSNSSIETSSIEGLNELSSLRDSSVEKNDSLTIDRLSDLTTEQEGGSEIFAIVSDSRHDSSSSSSSSDLESLDSDTSDSD